MYDCANAGYLKQKPPPVHVLTQLLASFFYSNHGRRTIFACKHGNRTGRANPHLLRQDF